MGKQKKFIKFSLFFISKLISLLYAYKKIKNTKGYILANNVVESKKLKVAILKAISTTKNNILEASNDIKSTISIVIEYDDIVEIKKEYENLIATMKAIIIAEPSIFKNL